MDTMLFPAMSSPIVLYFWASWHCCQFYRWRMRVQMGKPNILKAKRSS